MIEIEGDNEAPNSIGETLQQPKKLTRHDSKDYKTSGTLPTDTCKTEPMMSVTSYVTILEDLLLRLQINVAVAKGFQDLEFPQKSGDNGKKYIDLWPIQMSAEIAARGNTKQNVLTTNFDTCEFTIVQPGILANSPSLRYFNSTARSDTEYCARLEKSL